MEEQGVRVREWGRGGGTGSEGERVGKRGRERE